MCVKEDITLSDYTPDKEKIEICEYKAKAITLNTKYQDLKKISDKCSSDLKTCIAEKITYKS